MIRNYILVAFLALIVGAIIGGCYFDTFKFGAKWMQKKMIDKAIQWPFENVYDYLNPEGQERVESFRKYLEE